jgi:hypothetical protein
MWATFNDWSSFSKGQYSVCCISNDAIWLVKGKRWTEFEATLSFFCYIIYQARLKFWNDASEPQEVSRLQLFRMKLCKKWKSKFVIHL